MVRTRAGGQDPRRPSFCADTVDSTAGKATWVKRSHTFKAGLSENFRRTQTHLAPADFASNPDFSSKMG